MDTYNFLVQSALLVEVSKTTGASIISVAYLSRSPSRFNLSSLNGALESISWSQECHYLAMTPPRNSKTPTAGKGGHLNYPYYEKILPSASLVWKDQGCLGIILQLKVKKRAGKSIRM